MKDSHVTNEIEDSGRSQESGYLGIFSLYYFLCSEISFQLSPECIDSGRAP